MRITSKTLMVGIENDVNIGNDISLTLHHQIFLFESEKEEDGIGIDIDFTDVDNIVFLGMPVEEGHNGYKKFKTSMENLGIDIDKIIDEIEEKCLDEEKIKTLKVLYKTIVK